MTAELKTGRTDGVPTSYNLFFSNGLRLQTERLWSLSKDQREDIKAQLLLVVDTLRAAGIEVTGELK